MEQKPGASIILGVDPGTRITGYGIIRVRDGKAEPLDFGCIRPPPKAAIARRYLIIMHALEQLMDVHAPHFLAIETQFVYKNIQSAMKLGMARAMALVAAEKRNIPIFEYSPTKAKQAVTGSGASGKQQVQRMTQLLLSLPQIPEPEDAADALALALCHAHHLRLRL